MVCAKQAHHSYSLTHWLVVWVSKTHRFGGVVFFSILLGEFTLKLLKLLVARPRPVTNGELVFAHGFSFPSGHALASALFYGSLALLLCYSNANNRTKTIGAIILLFWIVLMAYDRVYLGVHYPSDVLGGFCLGVAWSCCSLALYLGF